MALFHSMMQLLSTLGLMALICMANRDFARKIYFPQNIEIEGCHQNKDEENWSTQSNTPDLLRSSPSNSRIRLFASATCAGSHTVLPVADSSWTIPKSSFITGRNRNHKRPSRMMGCPFPQNHPLVPAAISSVNT